jgi:hypothetical protein
MLSSKVFSLTQHLKGHDKDLYAEQSLNGLVTVQRRSVHWQSVAWEKGVLHYSRPISQFVLALTDTWQLQGNPVDWGIEPVLSRIKELDAYRDDSMLDQMRKERERTEELKQKSFRSEIRARAYDLRKEFAQATNEINTSTLAKVDRRRTKDAYRK